MSDYPDIAGPDETQDETLAALLQQLNARLNDDICCTLVYGSCLRSGDIYEGLLDLYLICDSYSGAYSQRRLAAANWLLPPNVFFAQQESTSGGPTLRCKVTVISLRDFQRGCSSAWFESYIWGRFAQPTKILQVRNPQVRQEIENALLRAAHTLLHNALPALKTTGGVTKLWEDALGLSYATELRTERGGRAAELALSAREFYSTLTRHHATSLGLQLEVHQASGELLYSHEVSAWQRNLCRLSWLLRRVQGKLFSIARLVKALFTFEGGLDYIAWKLARHSGEEVVIPDKVRQRPLIHLWAFFWSLYRRGIFK